MFGSKTYEDPIVGAVETGDPEYLVNAAREYEPDELTAMAEQLQAVYELKRAVNEQEYELRDEHLKSYAALVQDAVTGAVESVGDAARTLVGKTGETAQEAVDQAGNVSETAVDATGDVVEEGVDSYYETLVTREEGRQKLDAAKA